MKKSINTRLFVMICTVVIFTIALTWLMNTTTLEKYYLLEKQDTLFNAYKNITSYITQNDLGNMINTLDKIDANQNIEIVIKNSANQTVYATSRDFMKNKILIPKGKASTYQNYEYRIYIFSDNQIGASFIGLFGELANDYSICLRTPVQSIKESVAISNKFLVFAGIASILIASIVTLKLSKTFTKPIRELEEIATKIANLDFSQKYNVTTKDELGELGKSINYLSTNLEKTIQELKNANLELEKDVEETSKLSQMRSQFISDVSHELKTPIALIQGYTEGLVDGIVKNEEEKKYYYETILDEANKMGTLTKDLLDLSKIEYGGTEFNITDFDITELIKTLLKKNEILFAEKNIHPTFKNTNQVIVKGDSFRIEQVLVNYISNAIKHIDEKNILSISIDETDIDATVKVYNSGEKLSDEDLQRIWTRFYKIDTSRNRESGGTGLGLAVVKAIMAKHGTEAGVQNKEEGIEFYFKLNK